MRRPLLILAGVALVTVVLRVGCGGRDDSETEGTGMPQRVITPQQILHLAEHGDHPLRLRDNRDVLPGGLSAAMSPMIIDWQASDIESADPFVVVHNINAGGNPLEGITVLQTMRIPLDGVERVEWILVPLGRGGRAAMTHHGQLRFVFREDAPIKMLNMTGEQSGGDDELHDLLASWEAWRPPGVAYDIMQGMDPGSFRLGLRLYSGGQRFLSDALTGRDWFTTPLRLPGGAEGASEVLKVTLAMGDGVARHTVSEVFAESSAEWLAQTPADMRAEMEEQWRELKELAAPRRVARDDRINIPEDEMNYQTVVRSCATVAYYSIIVAVNRLHERGISDGVDREHLDDVTLDGDEPWMKEVSDASLGGILARSPAALRWLRANPFAVPRNIPGRMDKAGLVERRNGEAVELHYSLGGVTPWRPRPGNEDR